MATDTQDAAGARIQEFRQKLISHAHFLKGRAGDRLDLRNMELTRIIVEKFKFDRAIVNNCVFSFSSFAHGSFVGAKLSSTTFVHCNLAHCEFAKAEMRAFSIVHSNMTESKMASARGAEAYFTFNEDGDYAINFKSGATRPFSTDFSNSDFSGADLTGAVLPGGKFTGANLQGAVLNQANLSGADLSGANLMDVSLEGADIANVKLDGAVFSLDDGTRKILAGHPAFDEFVKGQDVIQDTLRKHESWALSGSISGAKANFQSTQLKGGDFRYRTLAAINFSGADIRACLFNEAVLAASDFSGAKASYCNFSNADARGIRFTGGNFAFCSFVDTDFAQLPIQGRSDGVESNFQGATFTNCDLTRAKLTPALLQQAKFVNCTRDGVKSSN